MVISHTPEGAGKCIFSESCLKKKLVTITFLGEKCIVGQKYSHTL